MEIIVRDWKLLAEVAALNVREDGIDLDRRIELTRLLTTARMLSATMFEVVERELEPLKPKQFAPEPVDARTLLTLQTLRNQAPETKTEIAWGLQVLMETDEHCRKVEGVQTLLDLEERQRQEEKSEGWEIRTDLNLEFMRDWRVNESTTLLGLHALDDVCDLNVAVEENNELKILDQWARPNEFDLSLRGCTVADLQPIVAWQTLKRLAHCWSSGWTIFLDSKRRYVFVFQQYACSPEQAYRIIDILERDHISSAVVLLDLPSKPAADNENAVGES
jgi:hypothetical protein